MSQARSQAGIFTFRFVQPCGSVPSGRGAGSEQEACRKQAGNTSCSFPEHLFFPCYSFCQMGVKLYLRSQGQPIPASCHCSSGHLHGWTRAGCCSRAPLKLSFSPGFPNHPCLQAWALIQLCECCLAKAESSHCWDKTKPAFMGGNLNSQQLIPPSTLMPALLCCPQALSWAFPWVIEE